MKKISLSSCITKLILTVIVIMGFIYGFSVLFPRAYNVLEGKVLGIEEDSAISTVKTTVVDTVRVAKPKPISKKALTVQLEHKDGCYLIPTKVNGIPMKMVLDTGASNLTISVVEYEFLRKQGLLKDTTVEECSATIANGDEVKCYSIIISEITIGNIPIKDVECSVMAQENAPILLGMNVLRKLGNFSIDYNKNILIIKN